MTESEAEPEPLPLRLRLRRALGRVRRQLEVDTFDVFTRDVTDEHAAFEAPEGYRFAWATPDDVARCDPYHTELDERERRLGIARLEIGHRAVVAFHGDTPVFTMWMNPRNLNVPGEVKRRLGAHQSFIYKAYTSPDHRGRGLYKVGMRFVLHELRREGKTQLVGYAHVKKQVSRKGLAALEFGTAGRYYSVHVFDWQHTFATRELNANFPERLPRTGLPQPADMPTEPLESSPR